MTKERTPKTEVKPSKNENSSNKYITESGKFRVMSVRCARCLFSQNPLVSAERRNQVLAECKQEGKFFVCHEKAADNGLACCKGFYDARDSFGCAIVQVAERWGLVEFVEPQGTGNLNGSTVAQSSAFQNPETVGQ
jgi:hypothetical protein